MVPTIKQLKMWFSEFNAEFFDNKLPVVAIKYSKLNFKTYAEFINGGRLYRKGDRKWITPFSPEKSYIQFNKIFSGSERFYKSTLLHEMIHLWQHFSLDYFPKDIHKGEFDWWKNKIESSSNYIMDGGDLGQEEKIKINKQFKLEAADKCSGYLVEFNFGDHIYICRIYKSLLKEFLISAERRCFHNLEFYEILKIHDRFYPQTMLKNKKLFTEICHGETQKDAWKEFKNIYGNYKKAKLNDFEMAI